MRTPLILIGLAAFSVAGTDPAPAQPGIRGSAETGSNRPRGGLRAFRSDTELRNYLRRLKRQQEAVPLPVAYAPPPPPPMPAPPPSET